MRLLFVDDDINFTKFLISFFKKEFDVDVPTIMLSGWAKSDVINECLNLGAVGFIEKSIDVNKTIIKIRNVFSANLPSGGEPV